MNSEHYANTMAQTIINELVGGHIIKAFITPEDEYSEAGFGFVVSVNGVNKVVHVLMDAEGNGPGFLDIQEATNECDQ